MPLFPNSAAAQALGVSRATLQKPPQAGTARGDPDPTRADFASWMEAADVDGLGGAAGGQGAGARHRPRGAPAERVLRRDASAHAER
jgi:hypothetical protein